MTTIKLWTNEVEHDYSIYMVKPPKGLHGYSKMMRVTCLARDLHKVPEEVQGQYPETDKFIVNSEVHTTGISTSLPITCLLYTSRCV